MYILNQKKFNDTICNVAEEIGFLSFDARSAASVLRLIVEGIDDSELQEQPYAALPGALALVEAVAEKMEKVDALSNEMLRLRVLVENDTKAARFVEMPADLEESIIDTLKAFHYPQKPESHGDD